MRSTILGLAVTAAMSQVPTTSMAAQQVDANAARVQQLCSDPAIVAKMAHPEDVCQVSPDGGKTGITMPLALLALLGAGGVTYMVRRKKTGAAPEAEAAAGSAPEAEAAAGSAPEAEAAAGSAPEAEAAAGSAPEAEAAAGSAPEAEAAAGSAPEAEHRSARSKWEDITQDIRYNLNDAHNAKSLLRRLVSKYSAGHGPTPTPEDTANSAFLNGLMSGLKSKDDYKKRIAIQKIFAIGKIEGLVSIPEPIL